MKTHMSFVRSVFTVWRRFFAVFRKNLLYATVTTFLEPFLYLASFGFGLGAMVGPVDIGASSAVPYRAFVLAGILGQTVLFIAFFDAAYGGFIRMYYQKIFQAIAVTPVTLSEVLWGELAWCTTRTLLSSTMVLAIGLAVGDFHLPGALLVFPLVLAGGLLFSALGMLVAAWSQTIESISYPQYFLVFPMFLFCGVYYPLSNLPAWMEGFAWVLPLTPFLSLARTFTLGAPFVPLAPFCLLAWLLLLVPLARARMRRRLLA